MTSRKNLIIAALAVLVLAGCGGGGINSGSGGGGGTLGASFTGTSNTEYGCFYGSYSRLDLAQSFVGAGRRVTAASFDVYRTGVGSGNYVVDIQADAGGLPSGMVLGTSSSIATASLSPTAAWQDFTFTSPITCNLGQTYWLVLRKIGGANNVGEGLIAKANTDPNSYPNGKLVSRSTDGSWQDVNNDARFRTYHQ